MNLRHGQTFAEAAPEEVVDFLRDRRLQEFQVDPQNLHVVNDGTMLLLRMSRGGVSEYPVREVFLHKLLKWYGFPARHLGRLNIDTVSSILNDFLLNIRSGDVTLKVENGEALSITSGRYNNISDLEVLELARSLGVASISRNDFFMRVYTTIRARVFPVPGDECGMGHNVFNSETGFRALSVHHFVLRYVCSNGAVIEIDSGKRQCVHYGHPEWMLRDFLEREIDESRDIQERVMRSIQESTRQSCQGNIERTRKRLRPLVGNAVTARALASLDAHASRYDLANIVTSLAREVEIGRRLQLERLGGELLAGRSAAGDPGVENFHSGAPLTTRTL